METADSAPTSSRWRLTDSRALLAVAGSVALGAAAAAGWWRVAVAPEQALARKRYESTLDVATMYGLQLSYKRAHGAYANDLASLLSVDPDAAALKARLARNVDMNTLTVVGDAQRFKVELNVLDADRTLIKVKGPLALRAPDAPSVMPALAPPMNANGAPIAPGR